MTLIDDFVSQYLREYDYYQEVARICAQQCEIDLEQNGIRAIVTYRAKRPDRLRQKLEERSQGKRHESFDDIRDDIVDLAGVRIALYFPGDGEEVDKLIRSRFDCQVVKAFPERDNGPADDSRYSKRFSGYHSTHYRVCMREDELAESQVKYALAPIEIQVASVLVHAWAEVEHDLVYKPLTGDPSEAAYAILDELNGIVLAGEIALERLQKDMEERASEETFSNHYELAAFLHAIVQDELAADVTEAIMGRADVLFRFLQLLDLVTAGGLQDFTGDLDPDRPIVQQLVDRIVAGDEERTRLYFQAKREIGARSPYVSTRGVQRTASEEQALGFFLSRWIVLETVLRGIYQERQPDSRRRVAIPPLELMKHLEFLDQNTLYGIDRIRHLRNQTVHGIEAPQADYLIEAGEQIEMTLQELRPHLSEDLQEIIDSRLDDLEGSA